MKRLLLLLPLVTLAGCMPGTTGGTADLFGGAVIETGKSDIAPSGTEYEVLFNKEVTNVHNSLVAVMSLDEDVDDVVCKEALDNFTKSRNSIDRILPAKGWGEKKEDFINTVNQLIEELNGENLDKETLKKLELRLSALAGTDSGATSLNL